MTVRRVVIVGAGGHGRETLATVRARPDLFEFAGFIDDGDVDTEKLAALHAAHVGSIDHLVGDESLRDALYTVGIGSIVLRSRIAARLAHREAAVLVHPTATIGPGTDLAPGVIVAPGAQLTTNVSVGRHAHVNTGCIVAHDCVVGAFTSLSPGVMLSGAVEIGAGAFLGTGAVVLPGRRIGAGATVGAGSIVTADVDDGATVKGVPAR